MQFDVVMTDQERPGWFDGKGLAIVIILAVIYVLLWVFHFLGLLKPIY